MPRNMARHTGLVAHAGLQRARESARADATKRAAKALARQGEGDDRHLIHLDTEKLALLRKGFAGGRPGKVNLVTGLESFATDEDPVEDGDNSLPSDSSGSDYMAGSPSAVLYDQATSAKNVLNNIPPPATAEGFELGPPNVTARSSDSASSMAMIWPLPLPAVDSWASDEERSAAVPVVLPNGQALRVDSSKGAEGPLMSPTSDLSEVAATGRKTGDFVRAAILNDPKNAPAAIGYLLARLGLDLGQGGSFDFQREGNNLTGWKHFPWYEYVSNFNIGLYLQQAGLPLSVALGISGLYASLFSKTRSVDSGKADLIRQGYAVGKSGSFEPSTGQ